MTATKTRKPKRKRKIVLWIFGAIFAFAVGLYFIPNFPFGPYTLYKNMSESEKSATIPYERLADSSLELGYTPKFKADAKALKRFPGVRECLVRSQAKADTPDLRLINWNQIYKDEEAEVCLWWIFLSLETPERAKAWFAFQGMGLEELGFFVVREPSGPSLHSETNRRYKKEDYKYPTRGPLRPLSYIWIARFYDVSWHSEGNIQNVQINKKVLY